MVDIIGGVGARNSGAVTLVYFLDQMDSFLRDLRSTARMLTARPGWTVAAVLCLAIATGANTAAFTLVNGLLLRPLPFPDSNQLVMVALRDPAHTGPRPFALTEFRDVAERSGTSIELLARTFFPLSLAATDGARMAQAEVVSGNYFDVLRVAPHVGRFFDASVDRPGMAPVVVLSHRLWQLRFGSDPSVVGRQMRANGRTVTVVAVARPDFVGAMQLIAADLWLPAAAYRDLAGTAEVEIVPAFGVMGRLAPGATATLAEARLSSIVSSLGRSRGASPAPAVQVIPAIGFGVPVAIKGTVMTLSVFIYVLMALLMAVACANVAALVLARGVGRTREIAVRISLGASRIQIGRQLLTESGVLAIVGCSAGSLTAFWLTQTLVAQLTTPFDYVSFAVDVRPDLRVFAYSALGTALAALLCGIAPIRHASRVDVLDALKDAAVKGRTRESTRTLNVIVATQFALSTALLVAAGTLVRAYVSAQSSGSAFETMGLIAISLDVEQIRLDRGAGIRLYEEVTERLSAIPGITNVALTRDPPFRAQRPVSVFAELDDRAGSRAERVFADSTIVSANYFRTIGMAISQGRAFLDREPAKPPVAVINQALARRLWPDEAAVGRRFRINRVDSESIEVIGIVADADNSAGGARPLLYRPFPQEYAARMTALVRVAGDTNPMFTEVRQTIRDVNQDLSIVDLQTTDHALATLNAQRRVPAAAFALVGLLALLLSALGLYGVMAYSVRERARELGIRLALGARPATVRHLVLRDGLAVVGTGLTLGAGAAVLVAKIVRGTFFGVGTYDPLMLATVGAVLAVPAVAAVYFPARWASALEPARILRRE